MSLIAIGSAFAMQARAYADQGDSLMASGFSAVEAQAAADSIDVALTVVDELDGSNVVYNGKVTGLTTNNTVADLLKVVGFTKVDAYKGNSKTYVVSNESPYFLGKEYNAETGAFWVTIYNGSSNNFASASIDAKLQKNGHYQYIYTNRMDFETWETTFEYTDQIPDPLTTKVSKLNQLLNNLAARFAKGGADSSISNTTYAAAMALSSLGKSGSIDVEALIENAKTAESPGTVAKYVLALHAAGKTDLAKEYLNKIDAQLPKTDSFYDLVLILPAYNALGVEPSGKQYTKAGIIETILKEQTKDGMFPLNYTGMQETAQAIIALAPYKAEPGVKSALEKALVAALKNVVAGTGIIGPSSWSSAKMDYDAMGDLIVAILANSNGKTDSKVKLLADALVKAADAALAGYTNDPDLSSEVLAAASVFRGLAAAYMASNSKAYLDNQVLTGSIADATADAVTKTYTGDVIKAAPAVQFQDNDLVKGKDYTVSYTNKSKDPIKASKVKAAGIYYMKLTGIGNFVGTKYVKLTVKRAAMKKATSSAITKSYTGKKINPVPVLKYRDKKLKKGTSFTVSYTNKKKKAIKASKVKAPGTYYIKVTGKGNFSGKKYVKLTVKKASVKKATSRSITKKYTGKKINPVPVLKYQNKKLKKGTDFTVSYTNKNKKAISAAKVKAAGTYYIKVTGKGNFTGVRYVKLKITK